MSDKDKKRLQKYRIEWEHELDKNGDVIGDWCSSTNDPHIAKCMVCPASINVANGKIQLLKHSASSKHVTSRKFRKTQPSVNVVSGSNSLEDKVLTSELRWAMFTAENNLSVNLSSGTKPLFKEMFEDSKVAESYSCGRSKTSYFLTEGLRPAFHDKLVCDLRKTPFALMIDESNKSYHTKYLHMVVRYHSPEHGKAITRFYKAVELNKASAENIVNAIEASFAEDLIPWSNVIQIMSDSPNVMRGAKKGVLAIIKNRFCPNLIDLGGCSLHHISNAINHATGALGEEIEEFAIDLHSFFKHRTGQFEEYQHVQSLLDVPEHSMLRFVGTRWLCILPVADRIVEQWSALKEFFHELRDKNPKVANRTA